GAGPIVDAELDVVHALSNVFREARRKRESLLAEVEEIVLNLPGPIRRKRVFHTRADGPAPYRLRRREVIEVVMDVMLVMRPGATALDVDERVVHRAPEPAGDRPECVDLAGEAALASLDVGPACIGLNPEHGPA